MVAEGQEGTGPTPVPTIHGAEPAPGPSGASLFGPEIDFDTAVARRRAGQDVVVRGDDSDANRRLAYRIEAAVGPPGRPQAPGRPVRLAPLPSAKPRPGRPPVLRDREAQGEEATM